MEDQDQLDYSSDSKLNARKKRDCRREHAVRMPGGLAAALGLGFLVIMVGLTIVPGSFMAEN